MLQGSGTTSETRLGITASRKVGSAVERNRAKRLGREGSRKTTADMLFTVETVACLGACGLAPVVVINDQVHGQVTPAGAVKLVEAIIAGEEEDK